MEEKQAYRRISKRNQSRDISLSAQMNRNPERATGKERPEPQRMPEGMIKEKFDHPFLHTKDRLSRDPLLPLGFLETLFPFLLMEHGDEKAPSEGASLEEQDH